MNYQKMTKKQLEEYGRTIGIELDLRKTKTSLIETLKAAAKPKTKKAAPKKPKTKKAAPKKATPKKAAPKKKPASTVVPQPVSKSFWDKIREFFNLD
jgi:cell division septation protein DedD